MSTSTNTSANSLLSRLPGEDEQIAVLQWLIDSLNTGAIPQADPIRLKVALLAADAQVVADQMNRRLNAGSGGACTLTYADMANAINAVNPSNGKSETTRPETLRKLHVFQLLDDKTRGRGVDYVTGLEGKTKTLFSRHAVDFVANNYEEMLVEQYGWIKPKKPRSGPDHPA